MIRPSTWPRPKTCAFQGHLNGLPEIMNMNNFPLDFCKQHQHLHLHVGAVYAHWLASQSVTEVLMFLGQRICSSLFHSCSTCTEPRGD